MEPLVIKKILVPVDFSPCSREAFRVALHFAKLFEADILLLHVIDTRALEALNMLGLAPPSEEKAQMHRIRRRVRLLMRGLLAMPETKGVTITRLLTEGKPFVEIARTARTEGIDLVVMGSYGGQTGDVERIFFGSTAERIVRTVNCPVLCVPLPHKVIEAAEVRETPSKPATTPRAKGRRAESKRTSASARSSKSS